MNYQRVWAEIDLDAVAQNTEVIRQRIGNTKLMAVVKADGYGHGAVEVSKVMLYHGAEWLGVAICDEGVALRENNVHVPILIFGYTPEAKMEDVLRNGLIQTVFSLDMAVKLSAMAQKVGVKCQVHIKVDTGMSRLGFLPSEESFGQICEIAKLPGLAVTGIYTHFADSDNTDLTFTQEQFLRFTDFVAKLENAGVLFEVKHCANSGAVVHGDEFNLDMVRTGIILYGLPSGVSMGLNGLDVKPAMSFKTQISHTKEVEAGISIGYGRTFFTQRKAKVATIPVGYADGYARVLSNQGRVLIRGCYAPIVGNICMDQFMVDVTDIEGVQSGDEVVLFGKQGDLFISAEELGGIQRTIGYEIVCCVGKRVPRVYLKNNKIVKMLNYIGV